MKDSEATIIKCALEGNQDAYREIIDRFRGQIYSVIYRMVRNRPQTEDLVQETFIKAFASLDTFNEEYAFSTWLYKIAINNCIDYFRKKRLSTFPIDKPIQSKDGEFQREFPDFSTSPESKLLSQEKSTIIEDAIASLPEKYRISIILRHSEDKSYEEISEILDIPLGTVKARIFRAREMLKKKLRQHLIS